jgi:outer membrane protein assembly factor BamB
VVHRGNLNTKGHKISSQASSDVVSDGERLFVNFFNNGAIFTTALDLSGKQLWQRRVCDFQVHQGFGSSPVIYQNIVLVSADHRGGGKMTGLNKLTGEIVWQQDRPPVANYASPGIVNAAGKVQAVLAGCNKVESFDPLTGKKLWSIDGSTEETVVTAVTDGSRVFLGGGYPKNHTMALEADGSGKIAWENVTKTYVPSMLVKNGHVFAVGDAGRAVCWKSATGEELWNEKWIASSTARPSWPTRASTSPAKAASPPSSKPRRRSSLLLVAKPTRRRMLQQPRHLRQSHLPPLRQDQSDTAGVSVVRR